MFTPDFSYCLRNICFFRSGFLDSMVLLIPQKKTGNKNGYPRCPEQHDGNRNSPD